MINSFVITTLATEGEPIQDVPEQNNGTEELNNDMQLIEKSDIITDTYGRIIEARSPREIQSGTVKDRVQDVKVEIIEGEYIGEEFETTFTLSYDIEGKIQAYELDVGDKVLVQLSEDLEGHVTATVQDVVRSGYIIGMFILFLLSIVLVGGKKGVKAILGLLYTIILIYLIMIKGIFKGDNAIILSVGTSMLVILGKNRNRHAKRFPTPQSLRTLVKGLVSPH